MISKYYLSLIIIVCFVLYCIYGQRINNKIINQHNNTTTGYVYFCSGGSLRRGSYVSYRFYVKGIEYISSCSIDGGACSYKDRKFEVRYLKEDPSQSLLFIDKEIFE